MLGITSYSATHMVVQARAKQLAIKSTQDRLQELIKKAFEDRQDQSGAGFAAEFSGNLSSWFESVQEINASFAPREMVGNVGYPIKFNKTDLQLGMVKSWVDSRDDIVSDLQNYVLHNGPGNAVLPGELPKLAAPSETSYWGNENPSVSTVLLYSAAHSLQVAPEKNQLVGAATFYPFLNAEYSQEGAEDNPFFYGDGALLFGDYQFGGHRVFSKEYLDLMREYFSEQIPGWEGAKRQEGFGQLVFAPEDCSSAMAKATGLTQEQVVGVYTGSLKEAYKTPGHEYGYQAITSSADGEVLDFDKIEAGDILLVGSHTAIIAEKDNQGNITVFEFNRDIDCEQNKMLGGGINYRNLIEDIQAEKEVYVMRSSQEPLGESVDLADLVGRVDEVYRAGGYADSPFDVQGDCSVFLAGASAGDAAEDLAAEDLGVE